MRDDDTDIEALPVSVSFRFVSFRITHYLHISSHPLYTNFNSINTSGKFHKTAVVRYDKRTTVNSNYNLWVIFSRLFWLQAYSVWPNYYMCCIFFHIKEGQLSATRRVRNWPSMFSIADSSAVPVIRHYTVYHWISLNSKIVLG